MNGTQWEEIGAVASFPVNAGACAMVGGRQVAIFNFDHSEWYAVQNECPHERQMTMSRGLIGDQRGEVKVACPLHKNAFSLVDGHHLGGNHAYDLATYHVKVEQGLVFVAIPGQS